MKQRHIYITEFDKRRLEELVAVAEEFGGHARNDLDALIRELDRAQVVPSKDVPPDVVTMNSKVTVRDLKTGEIMTLVLVFPGEAAIEAGKISVLAPVGTAMLGYGKGDVIEWPVPSGIRRLRIEDILYQPEAAGDYHR